MPNQDLLNLLDKTDETLRRPFTCPRLGTDLEVRLLPAHAVAAARAQASRDWGENEVRTAVDEQALSLLVLRAQMSRAIFHEGVPVGHEIVDRLDEQTLRHWGGQYSALEDEVDPPLESMSSEALDAFVEGLKKKDPASVVKLTISDGATLRALVLILAARLAKSATSTSLDASSESA